MTQAPPNSVCSICNYDLSGIAADENHHIICPECGTSLKPARPEVLFTKAKLKKLLLKQLVIPITIASALTLLLLPVPMAGDWAFFTYFLIAPVTQLVLYLNTITIGLQKSKPHPRPYPRKLIPLIAILACIPGIILYIIVIAIMFA